MKTWMWGIALEAHPGVIKLGMLEVHVYQGNTHSFLITLESPMLTNP
jgi:hypothetical protein